MSLMPAEKNIEKFTRKEEGKDSHSSQDLALFLTTHFRRLNAFFDLMDRAEEKSEDCNLCELTSMGRYLLMRFKEEADTVAQAIDENIGRIYLDRANRRNQTTEFCEILGVSVVPRAERRSETQLNGTAGA